MRFVSVVGALVCCLGVLHLGADALVTKKVGTSVYAVGLPGAAAVESFWTPTKIVTAQAVQLKLSSAAATAGASSVSSTAGASSVSSTASASSAASTAGASQGSPAASSVGEGLPGKGSGSMSLARKLFTEAEMASLLVSAALNSNETVIPLDASSNANPFTSSRVFPSAAVRSYPYRTVVKVFFNTGAGTATCSGSLIKKGVVLTAGHCVHSGNGQSSGWYTNFLVVPALDSGSAPYGTWSASTVYTTWAWYSGGGSVPNAADFALIILAPKSGYYAGSYTGYLGYATNALLKNHVHSLGYPGNFDSALKMHQVTSQTLSTSVTNTVLMGSDMRGGSSGGPWVQNFLELASGQTANSLINRVVGVTSYGPSAVSTFGKYQGSSILNTVFTSMLSTACSAYASRC